MSIFNRICIGCIGEELILSIILKTIPIDFISWHVKDYKELGESGKIDFKDIFKYQKIAGVQYILSEVEDYNFPPLYSVDLAWEYIYYELLK